MQKEAHPLAQQKEKIEMNNGSSTRTQNFPCISRLKPGTRVEWCMFWHSSGMQQSVFPEDEDVIVNHFEVC